MYGGGGGGGGGNTTRPWNKVSDFYSHLINHHNDALSTLFPHHLQEVAPFLPLFSFIYLLLTPLNYVQSNTCYFLSYFFFPPPAETEAGAGGGWFSRFH